MGSSGFGELVGDRERQLYSTSGQPGWPSAFLNENTKTSLGSSYRSSSFLLLTRLVTLGWSEPPRRSRPFPHTPLEEAASSLPRTMQ